MTIALSMALAFIAGVFCCLKSVQLGLKWQIQTSDKQTPTLEIPNPIKEHTQAKQAEKQVQFTNDIMDEWLNGAKER
jgi:hypothetical protein